MDSCRWQKLHPVLKHWAVLTGFLESSAACTVIQWHRAGFRLFWRWESRSRKTGRKTIGPDLITLIRDMNHANPLWGSPRIHGEMLKLGITFTQRTVASYMLPRTHRPPSQNWKAFLRNHPGNMVSVDFLTLPTFTFQALYVLIVLSHNRRRVLHFNVVQRPSAGWAAQQLREAFAFTSPPKYLLRLLKSYFAYYRRSRTHLGLDKDAPEPRPVREPEEGKMVAFPQVGGLHHRYDRLAA